MRVIRARFSSREEFLSSYLSTPCDGGMFYPTREALPVGQEMLVEVRFPGLAAKTALRCRVAWRRRGRHRSKLRAGVGIEFLPAEAHKRDFLLRVARGERERDALPKRRHRRVPTEMAVTWRLREEPHRATGVLDNIGLGGALLRTAVAAPVGRDIIVELAPPGAVRPAEVEGRIAWCVGIDSGEVAIGVQFKARDAGGVRRLKEVVRRVEANVDLRA